MTYERRDKMSDDPGDWEPVTFERVTEMIRNYFVDSARAFAELERGASLSTDFMEYRQKKGE